MTKKNFIKFVGWFGILTPVFALGFVSALIIMGLLDWEFSLLAVIISGINYKVGRKVLGQLDEATMKKGKKAKAYVS